MTTLQAELHKARQERLVRMQAEYKPNFVPIDRIRPVVPKPEPKLEPEPETSSKRFSAALPVNGPMPFHKYRFTITEIEDITYTPPIPSSRIPIKHIKSVVAERYGVDEKEMLSIVKSGWAMIPRQIGYYFARRLTSHSLTSIASAFGGRDHTTIMHGIRKIETLAKKEPAFQRELDELEGFLSGNRSQCPTCGAVH